MSGYPCCCSPEYPCPDFVCNNTFTDLLLELDPANYTSGLDPCGCAAAIGGTHSIGVFVTGCSSTPISITSNSFSFPGCNAGVLPIQFYCGVVNPIPDPPTDEIHVTLIFNGTPVGYILVNYVLSQLSSANFKLNEWIEVPYVDRTIFLPGSTTKCLNYTFPHSVRVMYVG